MDIKPEIKWRGSTYIAEKVEGNKVFWYNPVSRNRASCSTDSWTKFSDPYEGRYS